MQTTALRTVLLLSFGMTLLLAASGSAEPLSPEACAAVESEHAAMAAAGLPEILKSGVADGAGGLSAARAKEVARFIHLREQFLFRCGHDKKRATPAAVEGEGVVEAGPGKKAPATLPPPKRKPVAARPAPAQAGKSATETPAKSKATRAQTSPAAAKQTAKPRPKPDDAYRPPPKESAKTP